MFDDSRMHSVPIDDIIKKPTAQADYYVRLAQNKYILVVKSGIATPVETIVKYRAKSVDFLFITVEDYLRLLQGVVHSAGIVVASKTISDTAKLSVLKDAMVAIHEESKKLGFNDVTFAHAKTVNSATLNFLESNPQFADLVARMAILQEPGGDGVRHSMMVSMVSTMIGIHHDWNKPATLEKLALGGLLHDLGKIKLPEAILKKPHARFSHHDAIIYQSHPETGHQLLAALKAVPEDVALIALEHHEYSDGSGYPRGIKDFQISPLARVVCLANAFTDIVFEDASNLGPHTALRALETLEFTKSGQFNRDAMRALRRLVKGLSAQAA